MSFPMHLAKQYQNFWSKTFDAFHSKLIDSFSEFLEEQNLKRVVDLKHKIVLLREEYPFWIPKKKILSGVTYNVNLLNAWSRDKTKEAIEKISTRKDRIYAIPTIAIPTTRRQDADIPAIAITGESGITQDMIEKTIQSNVALIKTIEQEHFDAITKILSDGLQSGEDLASITDKIVHATGVNRSKAEFWARDQSSKFFGAITRERQVAAGIPGYIWRSTGLRTRDQHIRVSNKFFKWTDPPTIYYGLTSRKCHPGEDYNCNCWAEPSLGNDPNVQDGNSSLALLTESMLGNLQQSFRVSVMAATNEMNQVINMDKVYEQSPIQFQAMSETNPLKSMASGVYDNGVITLNESSANAMLTVVHETAHHLEAKVLGNGFSFLRTPEGQSLLSEIKNTTTFKNLLANQNSIPSELYSYYTQDSEIFTRIMEQYFANKQGGILKKELLSKANIIHIQSGVDLYLSNQEFKKIEILIDQIFKSKGLMR